MFLAVIRLGLRVARNLYKHFCFDRVDLEPAVGNFKRHLREVLALVIRELVSGQTHRVGTRVGALRFRGASKREVICRVQRVADAGNRIALDAVLLAVIRLGLRVARNLYNHFSFDRRNLQRSVDRLRNDILSCRVNRVNRTIRKRCRICSDIRSRRANFNRAEISVFRRTGKAGNALLLSIISLRLAVRLQLDVLIIVEIDLVLSLDDLNRLLFIRFRRNCVAFNRGGGCLHRFPERLAVKGLGSRNLLGRPVPVVVHRVAQVGSRPEYRFEHRLLIQTILLIQKRSGLCIRQIRTRVDALEVIFVDDLNPVVKFISGARGVSPYGRQIIADDRTVCFHNLARHDLHMLRNRIERLVELSVSVRRVNNFDVLFRVRHPLRGIRRGSLHRLRNLRSPAIKLPAGLAVLISRKSGSRIVIFCGVFLFRKGIGSMVALPILDRKGVLFVVENDLVRSLDDRDRLRGFRYQFIAFNIRCFLCHQFVKRLILHSLCIAKLLVRARLKVFHRVSQIVFSGVYNINRHVVAGHPAINNQFIRLIADDRRRSYAVESSILYIILRIRIL